MKKDILKLFYLPIIGWVLVSIVYFLLVYSQLNIYLKDHIKNLENIIVSSKKEEIKQEVKNFKIYFAFLQSGFYSYTENILSEIINLPIKRGLNKLIYNDFVILGRVPENKKLNYKIYKNRFIILNFLNKNFLVVLKNKGKKIYICGIRQEFIDDFILEQIRKYLDKINKHRASYIALGKILTLNPGKNGNFGYLFYMPPKLKNLEGLTLSVNKPDMRGHYFRDKYLKCFRENKDCFVSYYWKNPLTDKIEEKISYFSYLKEYNLSILKGFYKSQIINELNKKIRTYKDNIFTVFNASVVIYFIILIIFIVIQNIFLNKVKNRLLKNYEKLRKSLIKSFYYDSLTNLPNRNKLMQSIYKYKALILIDINDFSDINDVFGFEMGDYILKEFSKNLKLKFKNVYRIGSDEFAIGLDKEISLDELYEFFDKPIKIANLKIDITVGASNYKARLYESAEMALKFAFKSKDKKYILYDKNIYLKQKEKLDKINILKNVLEKKEIVPYYQCIVDKNGHIVKYEALMRIKIGNKIETPFFFMDLIKEARLYSEFSKIMIEKVLSDTEKINAKVSINLSYDDIVNEEMRNFILNSLNEKNASKIVFEILESESIENYELVKKFIYAVKAKGVELAIDDFGSGYSNLVQVLDLEPNIIKIDASLIKNIKEEKNYKMVELIINFAKTFNLKTVAEFVSNEEIFEIVKSMGIDEFQGFYFCEPEPLEKILKKDKISSKKGNNEN